MNNELVIHENWCLKSPDGMHCFHMIVPEDKCINPTKEVCCWCGKIQQVYNITGSGLIRHGKCKDKYTCMDDWIIKNE